MKRLILPLIAVLCLLAVPALAQQPKRVSPHDTISTVIDGNRVTIVYGRPYTKDPHSGETRKIWGGLVPFGQVWRTGADEATLLITQKPLAIGSATVPAGAYTLWTLPAADGSAVLIVNKQIGQWGVDRVLTNVYDQKLDVARIPLQHDALKQPTDQFTVEIVKGDAGGTLVMSWEKTKYSVPFSVKK